MPPRWRVTFLYATSTSSWHVQGKHTIRIIQYPPTLYVQCLLVFCSSCQHNDTSLSIFWTRVWSLNARIHALSINGIQSNCCWDWHSIEAHQTHIIGEGIALHILAGIRATSRDVGSWLRRRQLQIYNPEGWISIRRGGVLAFCVLGTELVELIMVGALSVFFKWSYSCILNTPSNEKIFPTKALQTGRASVSFFYFQKQPIQDNSPGICHHDDFECFVWFRSCAPSCVLNHTGTEAPMRSTR